MKELDFAKIGKKIKDLRLSKGLTQEYVANVAYVNTSHISNIENNRVKISLSTLVQVCNALDVTVDYVLADEYKDPSSPIDQSILKELQKCDCDTKERILKIITILI
jgi:transcriptional regulator with XRE-family HTH domain